VKYEIEHSKDQIQAEVGVPVKSLCYPNGDFNDNCVRVAHDSGYTNGVTTKWGHNKANDSLFTLRRMDIDQRRHRSFLGNLSIDRTKLRLTDQHPGIQK
jgi:peptidoglycan/xylan/chitin deacetylase (PgdA/CDA1 family)